MKLGDAWICIECDEVFEGNGTCPACGCREKAALTIWLPSMKTRVAA